MEWKPTDEQEIDMRNKISKGKPKRGKDWLINRLMAGGGILIAGFTIFYFVTFYDLFSGGKPKVADAAETTELAETQPETTTEDDSDYVAFESPYSDTGIAEETKTLLNDVIPGEPLVTGIMSVDNKISSVSRTTMGKSMTQYEKVKNIYDYMLYNFRLREDNAVDEDEVSDLCGNIAYKSESDKELAYRTERLLRDFSGDSGDYAAAFTLILRKLGLEAYYVEEESGNQDDSEKHGYAVTKINGEYYIFDMAAEKDEMDSNTESDKKNPSYEYFCKNLNLAGTEYSRKDVDLAMESFENFATLPGMNFEAMISNKSYSVFGSVTHQSSSYSDGNADMAEGELYVMMGDTVNLAGTVTSTGASNTWNLSAKIYDRNMNYINEYGIYNQTTVSAYNEVSFTATEGGYVQLQYSVTDIYDRTCVITHLFKIWTEEDFTTEVVTEPSTEEPETEITSYDEPEPSGEDDTQEPEETETDEKETTSDEEKETTTRRGEDKTEKKTEKKTKDETEEKSEEKTEPMPEETTEETTEEIAEETTEETETNAEETTTEAS